MTLEILLLLLVGTVAGLDLVSGPQILFARPIVAGTLSGLVVGDPALGVLLGGMLELFALEVLPVGATRYPDHGPGTVAAVWFASQAGIGAAGVAVLLALVIAEVGGWTLQRLRRYNGQALAAATPALDRGEPHAAGRLQVAGAFRDAARSLALTAAGLALVWLALPLGAWDQRGLRAVALIVLAAGLAGAAAGAVRTAGESRRGVVLAGGLILGWIATGYLLLYPRWGGS